MYRVYANKTQDLISARKFMFYNVYVNVEYDNLYHKIAQKLKL